MRIVRFLPWRLIIIGLCLTLAWQFRIKILISGVDQYVKNLKVDQLTFKLESFDFSNAYLSQLGFELSTNGETHTVQMENISLQYNIQDITTGNVDEVHADKIIVDSESSGGAEIDEINIASLLGTVLSIINYPLPVKRLFIKDLTISMNGVSANKFNSIILSMDPDKDQIDLQGYHYNSKLELTKLGNHILSTVQQDESELIFDANISITNERSDRVQKLSGEININLEKFRYWWQQVSPASLPNINGLVSTKVSAQQIQDQWKISLIGYTTEFKTETLAIPSAEFELHLIAPNSVSLKSTSISIENGSKLEMNKIDSQGIHIDKFALIPIGQVGLKDGFVFVSLTQESKLSMGKLSGPQLLLTEIYAEPKLNLSMEGKKTIITAMEGSSLSLRELKFGDTGLTELRLFAHAPSSLIYNLIAEKPSWKIINGSWIASNPNASVGEISLHSENVKIDINQVTNDYISLVFKSDQLYLNSSKIETVLNTIDGNIEQVGKTLKSGGKFRLLDFPPMFLFDIRNDNDNRNGRYSLIQNEQLDISNHAATLNNLIANWAPNVALEQGLLSTNIEGNWIDSSPIQHKIDFTLVNANGSYSDINFSGLQATGPIYYPPQNQSDSAKINIQSTKYGTEIENIESIVKLSNINTESLNTQSLPGIIVSKLNGEVLGSHFESARFEFNPNVEKNHIDISLDGLDINQIVTMQQIDGLNATGLLDGKLPIDILPSGINIELGQFWNQDDGGTIEYKVDPAQVESLANPLTDVVIKALEEFHYNLLTASVNFQPNGETSINFHIEGKSPKLDSNRPVHLNINSEQNVLSLLRSLKYVDDLNSGLTDQIHKNLLSTDKIKLSDEGN